MENNETPEFTKKTVLSPDIHMNGELEIISKPIPLGGKGNHSIISVPPGRVYLLGHNFDTYDEEGLPEIYLPGETLTANSLDKDADCLVADFAKFPGEIRCNVDRSLAAVSIIGSDAMRFNIHLWIRLDDPQAVLDHSKGKWMTEQDCVNFNESIKADIFIWLRRSLDNEIQLWSAEKEYVEDQIYQFIDSRLRQIGLRLDPTKSTVSREYPMFLYEIALQFAKAEDLIPEAKRIEEQNAIQDVTGLNPGQILEIQRLAGKKELGQGTGLFMVIRDASDKIKNKITTWSEMKGLPDVASFLRNLYSGEFSELDVALSEQVLLAALRKPLLTLGEWLERK